MANIFSKAKVSVASDSRHAHNFVSQHITTADFFQLAPVYARELMPNTSVKIDCRPFARMASMPVPTYGNAKLNVRAFFVPFRTVWPAWNDFITDTLHINHGSQYSQLPTAVPLLKMQQVSRLLYENGFGCGYSVYSGSINDSNAAEIRSRKDYDIAFENTQEQTIKLVKLYPLGRMVVKILLSLGYTIHTQINTEVNRSALPLLCFLRAYLDYYYPAQYFGDTTSALLQSLLIRDDGVSDPSLIAERLAVLFRTIAFVGYGEDYLTSAFDSPVGPANFTNSAGQGAGPSSDTTFITDVNGLGRDLESGVVSDSNNYSNSVYNSNTPYIAQARTYAEENAPISSISQYVLDALKSLTDYMKRHQLAGARAFERFATRFGVELKDEKVNRSIYLGGQESDMLVQDVFSTADTEGAGLADYAGKGFIPSDNCQFTLEPQPDFGMFLILANITPVTPCYQGIQRHVNHTTRFDFFTPEFDALGTQAIAKEEVYSPLTQTVVGDGDSIDWLRWSRSNLRSGVFGFTPRYAEYKIPYNQITGDFRLLSDSVGDTSAAWHLFRTFDNETWPDGEGDIVHNKNFVQPTGAFTLNETNNIVGFGQYNRIFDNTSSFVDHFYLQYFFKTQLVMPAKPLFDTYEFKDEDEHASRIIDVNGAKLH